MVFLGFWWSVLNYQPLINSWYASLFSELPLSATAGIKSYMIRRHKARKSKIQWLYLMRFFLLVGTVAYQGYAEPHMGKLTILAQVLLLLMILLMDSIYLYVSPKGSVSKYHEFC